MSEIEQRIVDSYVAGETSLREVAKKHNTDHHRVKRVLEKYSIEVTKVTKKRVFSEEHRQKLSESMRGKIPWSKGKKMTTKTLYKNMASHIRFEVDYTWYMQFEDVEKVKLLNDCITNRGGRFEESTDWYKDYIHTFYYDEQFNKVYHKWVGTGTPLKKPSIDHIVPVSKGGDNSLSNLQFLSWFENKCKSSIPYEQWMEIKQDIADYLLL